MATNLPSCLSIQFLEQLLKFLVNFTLLKYVKSQRRYGLLITKELIFGFQILVLKDHFSASLMGLSTLLQYPSRHLGESPNWEGELSFFWPNLRMPFRIFRTIEADCVNTPIVFQPTFVARGVAFLRFPGSCTLTDRNLDFHDEPMLFCSVVAVHVYLSSHLWTRKLPGKIFLPQYSRHEDNIQQYASVY